MPPPPSSTVMCCGIQPVWRSPTLPDCSSALRKAWAMNGLNVAASGLAHASQASASMSAMRATMLATALRSSPSSTLIGRRLLSSSTTAARAAQGS